MEELRKKEKLMIKNLMMTIKSNRNKETTTMLPEDNDASNVNE
jgi:hypothetical protein